MFEKNRVESLVKDILLEFGCVARVCDVLFTIQIQEILKRVLEHRSLGALAPLYHSGCSGSDVATTTAFGLAYGKR